MSISPNTVSPSQRGESIARILAAYPLLTDPRTLTLYAQALAMYGVHITVLPPGEKKAWADYRSPEQRAEDIAAGRTKKSWQLGTTDPNRIASYIATAVAKSGRIPNVGVSVTPSRIVVVDCDNAGDVTSWQAFAAAHGSYAVMNVASPGAYDFETQTWKHRDGGHGYYVLDDDVDMSTLRDVTEGGVTGFTPDGTRDGWALKCASRLGAALPPSVRPEGAYRWAGGEIPVAPEWLVAVLRKPPVTPRAPRTAEDIEFSNDVDEALSGVPWNDVFQGVATEQGQDADGCTVWQRFGGSPRSMVAHQGCAAAHGSSVVTVHSDSIMTAYPLLSDLYDKRGTKNFTKWEVLAAFQHDGSMSAVAEVYGFSRPKADFSEVFAPADLPFTVVRLRESLEPETPEDACPHGAHPKLCLPCLRARRADLNTNTSTNGDAQ